MTPPPTDAPTTRADLTERVRGVSMPLIEELTIDGFTIRFHAGGCEVRGPAVHRLWASELRNLAHEAAAITLFWQHVGRGYADSPTTEARAAVSMLIAAGFERVGGSALGWRAGQVGAIVVELDGPRMTEATVTIGGCARRAGIVEGAIAAIRAQGVFNAGAHS